MFDKIAVEQQTQTQQQPMMMPQISKDKHIRPLPIPTSTSNTKSITLNNNNSYSKPQLTKSIQLQVNVSIGKNKFLLQVEKCSQLHEEVQKFLVLHGINLKYEGPILTMVREQLAKKQEANERKNSQLLQLQKVKSQMQNRKKLLTEPQQPKEQTTNYHNKYQQKYQKSTKKDTTNQNPYLQPQQANKQNKQNYPSQYNSNSNQSHSHGQSKHGISTEAPGQSQAESNVREEEAKCQDVYQRWKVKEKAKQKQRIKNNMPTGAERQQSKSKVWDRSFVKQKQRQKQPQPQTHTSKSHKNLQTHSPDHFYSKGLKFNHAKQIHTSDLYKEHYPFQQPHRQTSLTPTHKANLHERLYKQYEVKQKQKQEKQIINLRVPKDRERERVVDKYMQRVIERDSKVSEALGLLLEKGMIQNPYRIQVAKRSPFRRTNVYHP